MRKQLHREVALPRCDCAPEWTVVTQSELSGRRGWNLCPLKDSASDPRFRSHSHVTDESTGSQSSRVCPKAPAPLTVIEQRGRGDPYWESPKPMVTSYSLRCFLSCLHNSPLTWTQFSQRAGKFSNSDVFPQYHLFSDSGVWILQERLGSLPLEDFTPFTGMSLSFSCMSQNLLFHSYGLRRVSILMGHLNALWLLSSSGNHFSRFWIL